MRLSKTTGYAIRILLDCARADGALVKVAEISARRDITPQNTFKIVHLLSRAGFLSAVRGRNGGVRLARPARAIRIGDVVRAMETMRFEAEGAQGGGRGGGESLGKLDHLFDSALEAFISVLDEHTLEDMTKAAKKPAPAPGKKSGPAAKTKPAAKPGGYRRHQVGLR